MVPDITFVHAGLAFLVCFLGESLGIYGGGGFFIQPALLVIGVPPQMAVAHDVSAAAGASATGWHVFHRNGKINYRFLLWWLPGLVIGPILGIALLSIATPAVIQKFIIVASLIGAFLVLFRKNGTAAVAAPRYWRSLSLLSGLALGFWSGFSGLGSGTISLLILALLFGQSVKEASGTRMPLHLITEVITAIGFLLKGWLVWQLFFPMLAGCLLAGYAKSHLVLWLPEKLLKIVFFASVVLVAALGLFKH